MVSLNVERVLFGLYKWIDVVGSGTRVKCCGDGLLKSIIGVWVCPSRFEYQRVELLLSVFQKLLDLSFPLGLHLDLVDDKGVYLFL